MAKRAHSNRADLQGAAYAEALLAIPVLGALLAGVLLFNGMYSAKIDAMSKARRQAWINAMMEECPESDSGGCTGSNCGGEGEVSSAIGDAGGVEGIGDFLGDVVEFLTGNVTTGTATSEAYVPKMFGESARTHAGRVTFMCNAGGGTIDSEAAIGEGKDNSGVNEAMQ